MQHKNEMVNARVTPNLKRDLERHAHRRGASVSDVVRELIETHLSLAASEVRELSR